MQRVFAARSESARGACLWAGGLYLLLGAIPVLLGLAAGVLLPEDSLSSVLPQLAESDLGPELTVLFVLTLLSAVLSTIDSALLAPATVCAGPMGSLDGRLPESLGARGVFSVAMVSLALAFLEESAYGLLSPASWNGLPARPALRGPVLERAGGTSSAVEHGTRHVAWSVHMALGFETFLGLEAAWIPMGLGCMGLSFLPLVLRKYGEPGEGRNE